MEIKTNISTVATQTDATQTEEEAPVACSVCYERVESVRALGYHTLVTRCGHLLCCQCLRAILSRVRKCPVCRKGITSE